LAGRSTYHGKPIDESKTVRSRRLFDASNKRRIFPASLKETETTMTYENNKSECIDAIVRMLERTSAWRRSIAPNFEDPRIARAADTLDKLAVDATAMSDEQFQSLEKYFAWDSLQWRNGLSLAARQIGFHNRSNDFGAFVRALVHELSLSQRAVA
jgi:hypothetical protein